MKRGMTNRLVRAVFMMLAAGVFFGRVAYADGQARSVARSVSHVVRAARNQGTFLLISDIHLNPLYEVMTHLPLTNDATSAASELFSHMIAKASSSLEEQAWDTAFADAGYHAFSTYGNDSNFSLFTSALDAAQQSIPNPDFILIPGDFLGHNWHQNFHATLQQHYATLPHLEPGGEPNDVDTMSYYAFTRRTLRILVGEFKKRFGSIPMLPALGNNDAYCGDYMIEPEGPFLKDFADIWVKEGLLPEGADLDAFQKTFKQGGYYSIDLPTLSHHRIIVLNTILFSPTYKNNCGSTADRRGDKAARTQLAWFKKELQRAHKDGKVVWLVMHIPPGVEAPNTYASGAAGLSPKVVPMWQPAYLAEFLRTLDASKATVQVAFAGHEHMDDFKIVTTPSGKQLLTKIAPSISPIFRNNPGYQVFTYDKLTGDIATYQTYHLTNLTTGKGGTELSQARWGFEYDFAQAYGGVPFEAAALAQAFCRDAEIQSVFARYYTLGVGHLMGDRLQYYLCACHTTPDTFEACLRGQAAGHQRHPGVGKGHTAY